jgi:hypothetical protein
MNKSSTPAVATAWEKGVWSEFPSYTAQTRGLGFDAKVTVWRTTPGVWSVEIGGLPVEQHFSTVHEAKRYALRWLDAMRDEQALPVVTLDWYQGERNVRFLAATGDRTQALWNVVLADRAKRAALLAEQSKAAEAAEVVRVEDATAEVNAALAAEAAEAAEAAKAPTRGQEYRGIVITVTRAYGNDNHDWFFAKAGGRSRITRAFTCEQAARDAAISAIDDAHACQPERIALWLNDTAHWRAADAKRVEMVAAVRAEAKRQTSSITIAPTWAGTVNALILALEHGSEEGKRMAREELRRMATVADRAVAQSKEG